MSSEKPTRTEKMAYHRQRFKMGQAMLRQLKGRSLDETHDTLMGRESDDINVLRRAVWKAENDAIRADPYEDYLPSHIKSKREQGI